MVRFWAPGAPLASHVRTRVLVCVCVCNSFTKLHPLNARPTCTAPPCRIERAGHAIPDYKRSPAKPHAPSHSVARRRRRWHQSNRISHHNKYPCSVLRHRDVCRQKTDARAAKQQFHPLAAPPKHPHTNCVHKIHVFNAHRFRAAFADVVFECFEHTVMREWRRSVLTRDGRFSSISWFVCCLYSVKVIQYKIIKQNGKQMLSKQLIIL